MGKSVNASTIEPAAPAQRRAGVSTSRRRSWIAAAAAAAIGLLWVASMPGSPGASPHSGAADPTAQARIAAQRRIAGDPLALGSVNAPIVVAEWGDFQCPFCRAFSQDTQPALSERYVNTGQVRFEWHDLAKIGPESVLAARAARAAGRQGRFWQFHDALYAHQAPENSGALTAATLTSLAAGLGLDLDRFTHDVDDPAISAQVDQDGREATRLGITHVPSFLVQDTVLVGTQSEATLRQVIDDELARNR
jgi:protein-disulfide isomerase